LPERDLPQYFLGSYIFANQNYGLIAYSDYINYNYQCVAQLSYNNFPAPDAFRSMASDGSIFVVVGTNSAARQIQNCNSAASNYTLYRSPDGLTFDAIWGQGVGGTGSNLFDGGTPTSTSRPCGGYSVIYGGINAPVWIAGGAGDFFLYKSFDSLTWNRSGPNYSSPPFPPSGAYEIYALLAVPTQGNTLFLAGGSTYGSPGDLQLLLVNDYNNINTGNPFSGFWTYKASAFSGAINSLATNGKIIVAAVSNANSLLYSFVNGIEFQGWNLCQGSIFSSRANSVIWNGSIFIAGGDSGIRHSQDGITWYNPGGFSSEIFNLGSMSNAYDTVKVGSSNNVLLLQDAPDPACQRLISAATVSYYPSSILNLNNALVFGPSQTIGIYGGLQPMIPQALTIPSTFYASTAYVSTVVSTNRITLGSWYLGVQTL
jgi:hypothetical protein